MARGDFDETCPSRQLIEFMSDKWVPALMHHLAEGPHRHGDLARRLPNVSQKMLTQTLRKMERWGVVVRTVYDDVPPRVEYALSEVGHRLTEPFDLLCRWAERHEAMIFELTRRRGRRSAPRPEGSANGRI
jgi:DNA-binding HxlR family transcriptional regulator